MDNSVSVVVAFGAGLLSFLSPCVLPLVPGYIGHLSGSAVAASEFSSQRRTTFSHAMVFVSGFSLVLIILGASAAYVGSVVTDYLPLLQRISGVMLVILGLHLIGVFKIPFLLRERRLNTGSGAKPGYWRSFLVGTAFSLGWTPCVGPILGAIFALALTSATVWKGTYLLGAYSLGLGIPFLLIALALSTVSGYLRRLNRYLRLVSLISGALLIAVGVLIFTNTLARFSAFFDFFNVGSSI